MAVKLDLDDIQGLIARGYRTLPYARFTIFAASDATAAHALLSWLLPQVAPAGRFAGDSALHLAYTPAGLRRLGLPESAIAGFSPQFIGGMTGPNRSRFLGDVGESDPRCWAWGGPQEPPVEGLILLYASSPEVLDARQADLAARLDGLAIRQVTVLDTLELGDNEPFGFHDGISQPIIQGLPKASGPAPARTPGGRVVPVGEFVLGYPNAYGQLTSRPLLPAADDPRCLLPRDPAGSGAADLGRNGCYLVLRQLEQDVDAFWSYVRQAAAQRNGSADAGGAIALAAKMVGRWPSGAPLVKAPDRDNPQLGDDNDFGYYRADPLGLACPLGAHVRRMNPRDSLDPQPGTEASLAVNDGHRLLRRGRSYGPGNGTPAAADKDSHAERLARADAAPQSGGGREARGREEQSGGGREARGREEQRATGLHFICLAASLIRQFEFVQHTWLNNPTFHGLYDDTDPLTGNRQGCGATFTEPARPVRRRYRGLPQFVR
ncbi:MAG: peroxidase, partial [Actinobacteria bacterium]|nr:peroxidase [Actinomycetota bacterium]